MFSYFLRLLHTIKYLKLIQIRYQIWYRILRVLSINHKLKSKKKLFINELLLCDYVRKQKAYEDNSFTFLNICHSFKNINKNSIQWNINCYGKLWAYNLNYMDYILQEGIDTRTSISLIDSFIHNSRKNSIGLEPYPTSLRTINWIKFLTNKNTKDYVDNYKLNISYINNSLHFQYLILYKNIEYHLLANHVLENAFSLLFGAFYFKDNLLYKKAYKILSKELKEQILEDGAHFELSPMYHQIILERLLDCINLVNNNNIPFKNIDFLRLTMNNRALNMLSWLNNITLKNGSIPLFNDSTICISASTEELNCYAKRLGLNIHQSSELKSSGYRRYNGSNFECILDIGNIIPKYQPGHSHADTFNFILNINNFSIIIDQGISTYETGLIRDWERGTLSHNTISINNRNSSDIWSSFRVGKRAKVNIIKDSKDHYIAEHNGYINNKITHKREWLFEPKSIEINDMLIGRSIEGSFNILLSPEITLINDKTDRISSELFDIIFCGHSSIAIKKIRIANGYNLYQSTNQITVHFNSQLRTLINIYN